MGGDEGQDRGQRSFSDENAKPRVVWCNTCQQALPLAELTDDTACPVCEETFPELSGETKSSFLTWFIPALIALVVVFYWADKLGGWFS